MKLPFWLWPAITWWMRSGSTLLCGLECVSTPDHSLRQRRQEKSWETLSFSREGAGQAVGVLVPRGCWWLRPWVLWSGVGNPIFSSVLLPHTTVWLPPLLDNPILSSLMQSGRLSEDYRNYVSDAGWLSNSSSTVVMSVEFISSCLKHNWVS